MICKIQSDCCKQVLNTRKQQTSLSRKHAKSLEKLRQANKDIKGSKTQKDKSKCVGPFNECPHGVVSDLSNTTADILRYLCSHLSQRPSVVAWRQPEEWEKARPLAVQVGTCSRKPSYLAVGWFSPNTRDQEQHILENLYYMEASLEKEC